jgi:hypothetical protein
VVLQELRLRLERRVEALQEASVAPARIQEFPRLLDAGPRSRPGQAFTGMTVQAEHTFSVKF